MEQRLIFLDIDGTLLIPGQGIRPCVCEGLMKARANGHRIFICTGRALHELPKELEAVKPDGVIASAGSDIWLHGENVYRTWIEPSKLCQIMQLLEELDAIYLLEGFDQIYVSENGSGMFLDDEPIPDNNPELISWKAFLSRLENVKHIRCWHLKKQHIPKITSMLWGSEKVELLRKTLQQQFDVAAFPQEAADFFHGEVIPKAANKGTAIHKTAEILGVDFQKTVAFGDSMNDYQMIEQAAVGIVMENGDEKLKAIADRVCESVWEDGVIRELERMQVI